MYGVIAHSYLDFDNTILSESSRHFIIGHVKMTSRVIITPCYLGKIVLCPDPTFHGEKGLVTIERFLCWGTTMGMQQLTIQGL